MNSCLVSYLSYIEEIKTINQHSNLAMIKHHILPKSLDGNDNDNNLVYLTPSQHIKAHELLFNAYFEMTKTLGHIVLSMASNDTKLKNIYNKMQEYDDAILRANILNKKKRIILDIETLTEHKIGYFDDLPNGYIEKLDISNRRSKTILIFKIHDNKLIKRRWPKDLNLPITWSLAKDAPKEIYEQLFPKHIRKQQEPKRYIHNLITNKNKLIPKTMPLPEGFAEGIYLSDEAKEKQRLGGLKCKELYYSNPAGYRYVHNTITNKNLLIEKDKPLPEGFAEGMYMSNDKRQQCSERAIKQHANKKIQTK